MRQISIDALNAQLFETIEMLKNNRDSKASDNEKIDIETARAISDIGKVIVDGYKVKAQVMNIIRNGGNPSAVAEMAIRGGVMDREQLCIEKT